MTSVAHITLRLGFACGGLFALAACSGSGAPSSASASAATTPKAVTAAAMPPAAASANKPSPFRPPPDSAIPDNAFGAMVRKGEAIFNDTQHHAAAYVGNGLNCTNCHINGGRQANSAPLWAAWVNYPAYRKKNGHVNSYGERIQGCFKYSMNGKPPPLDSEVMVALESYSFWLATGAPTGTSLPGRGYPKKGFKPPQPPDYARGEKVFTSHCALCHGANGQGQRVAGTVVFPALWGSQSFNWGAGMHKLDNAAAFIKYNMPLGRAGTLSDQDAWDVAMYMDAHERPQDPRYTGNLAETRKKFHDSSMSLYGTRVNGKLLGEHPAQP
ncbi:c-type cytochrome [Oleiagrimonas sp.]|jgi:thiosulfate dehydrogenase|uniref:c-type cytochrome n=1 Tax=Oleiagrimonas sp. TaxID=2010330 RepID=UPI002636EB84|nr:c-type cytochrome [Oleiagrimonas sp.]MDA3913059.1 c-type cytochrome [Oleiagrimonas sp.]